MAIKQVDEIEFEEKNELTKRLEEMIRDILEIIKNRWPVTEIINPLYTENTMRDGFNRAIRIICREYVKPKNTWWRSKSIRLISRTVKGEKKWYILFDEEQWDEMMKGEEK